MSYQYSNEDQLPSICPQVDHLETFVIIRSISRSWRLLKTPLDGSLAFNMRVTGIQKVNYTKQQKLHHCGERTELWISSVLVQEVMDYTRLFGPFKVNQPISSSRFPPVSLTYRWFWHGCFSVSDFPSWLFQSWSLSPFSGSSECDTGRHVKWWLCPGAHNIKYTTLAATCRYSTACPTCRKHYDISVSAVYLSAFSPCLRCINNNL